MAFTVVALVGFIAPSVLDGNNALVVCVVGASAIAIVSLYVTHGFSPTTTVALAGTLGALLLTLGLAWVFFELSRITGLGTEEALILPFVAGDIDLAALLLGGAIIGARGARRHHRHPGRHGRRTPQSPARPQPRRTVRLRNRVGRSTSSTVNTLLLAYAGASMPLLLLFSTSDQSLDLVANSEIIAVEIVRTLCGSMGLVAAVPITTAMAALVVSGERHADHDPAEAPDSESVNWEDFSPEEFDGL